MKKRDYYEVLGIARDADAVRIKRAYRELALRFHPDQNPGNPDAEASFKEVSEAYTVLSDTEQRARYDRRGHDGVEGFGLDLGMFTDLFDNLFGKKKSRAAATGRDLRYTLEVRFEEAALGCEKSIHFPSRASCEACASSGQEGGPATMKRCASCDGKGEIKVQQGFFNLSKRCPTCSGQGKLVTDPCAVCHGAGVVDKERDFVVTLPPGTEDGAVKRIAGQGEPGLNGGPAGYLDVFVRVKPHPLFRRQGAVISCDVPVSMVDAVLGAVVDVPTLEGPVEMKVPAGTQSGTVFRLRGKGMPTSSSASSSRGDAHVKVVVETPTALDDKQRALVTELGKKLTPAQGPERARFVQLVSTLRDPVPE